MSYSIVLVRVIQYIYKLQVSEHVFTFTDFLKAFEFEVRKFLFETEFFRIFWNRIFSNKISVRFNSGASDNADILFKDNLLTTQNFNKLDF